ncbi:MULTISPECIES: heme-binding domain-containing protein [Chryseobacterium]|uniref:heme-binding domain-containing protein n=1 Tax=Chryseobacterium TaxID=59732 RepID=UPI000F508D90|nr:MULTISPECIES: heme-binding domain-containing protein [Chryseobacterium]AZB34470.1 cytochrome C [Chryseobacterium bernardetii]UCA58143.1 heme-binding domain-containing protein [Chryseobacterium rhizoplanae]
MKTAKKILLWTLVAFALIQLIPIDRTNKPVDSKVNFVQMKQAPEKVSTLLKNACYDCHSDETVYPRYAYVAPISWSVKSHVNDGRQHLNFSVWGTYNKELKENMLDRSIEALKHKTMPLPGYIVYHDKAKLTEAERALLIQYFEEMLKSKTY